MKSSYCIVTIELLEGKEQRREILQLFSLPDSERGPVTMKQARDRAKAMFDLETVGMRFRFSTSIVETSFVEATPEANAHWLALPTGIDRAIRVEVVEGVAR